VSVENQYLTNSKRGVLYHHMHGAATLTSLSLTNLYYLLPVFYGDRFVARVDSRLEKGTWTITRCWWEADTISDFDLRDALSQAMQNFLHFLRADSICFGENVDGSIIQIIVHRVC
jgi:hypothetical protein